ncbi:CTAG/PCC1 family protein [Nitrosopumilus sp. K4]|uniref:KEOPS complex subunit Pcc1 n=1 Tax=Nitrosopumilus sp. K4 TaxID=2795383 RepID=UPI001BAA9FF1|nr:KEOPS complex subunit Pcc1 [Nitrosopumilus sp. K4]QUC64847.1 CTAG/PCC1 family protein [Nitrosopumilus sp. K4]
MSLTCQVQVILNNLSDEKADAVKKAIEPDNVNFPEGLSLSLEKIDNKLVFNFESRKDMKKLIGTIDEVLEHVQVALKVIE